MRKLIGTILVTAAISGCAHLPSSHSTEMTGELRHLPVTSSTSSMQVTPSDTMPTVICHNIDGQLQSYLQNVIATDRQKAIGCLEKGGVCWDDLAATMNMQKSGVDGLLAHAQSLDCAASLPLLHTARAYLQASALVANDCASGGVKHCFSTSAADRAKDLRKKLHDLVGSAIRP